MISWRMSPSGNLWIMGLQPSLIHRWIESRRHLESVSMTIFWLAASEFSKASAAAACSELLEDSPSSPFQTLQQPPVPMSCL